MALTLDGTNGIVSSGSITTQSATGVIFSDSSSLPAASSPYVLKNRIINGDMRIDQRNAGASVTITTNGTYTLDRWVSVAGASSKYSVQQNAAAVTPPAGFSNYLGVTSLSALATSSGDFYCQSQIIEGFNIADLAWGTANAKTVTLSFWVRSSLTGQFGGSIRNSASTFYSYPFNYTISSANTWTQVSITITGPTVGTWSTNNAAAMYIFFNIGSGSSNLGAANSWQAINVLGSTGDTSVLATNGATWYVTGVQLEQNTSATPFERRMITNELQLCQRYYVKAVKSAAEDRPFTLEGATTGAVWYPTMNVYSPVSMRSTPTVTVLGTISYATCAFSSFQSQLNGARFQVEADTSGGRLYALANNTGAGYSLDSEL
jgi:hypothetical protein